MMILKLKKDIYLLAPLVFFWIFEIPHDGKNTLKQENKNLPFLCCELIYFRKLSSLEIASSYTLQALRNKLNISEPSHCYSR